MAENNKTVETFEQAEARLMKAISKLDGVVGGTLQNFDKIKKELTERKAVPEPLLGNEQIRALQEENKRLQKEKADLQRFLDEERGRNEKLMRLKLDVSDKIENMINQLEKVI